MTVKEKLIHKSEILYVIVQKVQKGVTHSNQLFCSYYSMSKFSTLEKMHRHLDLALLFHKCGFDKVGRILDSNQRSLSSNWVFSYIKVDDVVFGSWFELGMGSYLEQPLLPSQLTFTECVLLLFM